MAAKKRTSTIAANRVNSVHVTILASVVFFVLTMLTVVIGYMMIHNELEQVRKEMAQIKEIESERLIVVEKMQSNVSKINDTLDRRTTLLTGISGSMSAVDNRITKIEAKLGANVPSLSDLKSPTTRPTIPHSK